MNRFNWINLNQKLEDERRFEELVELGLAYRIPPEPLVGEALLKQVEATQDMDKHLQVLTCGYTRGVGVPDFTGFYEAFCAAKGIEPQH